MTDDDLIAELIAAQKAQNRAAFRGLAWMLVFAVPLWTLIVLVAWVVAR